MLRTLLIILILAPTFLMGQSIYKTSAASVSFSSEAPLEIIQAESKKLVGLIDIEKRTFAFQVATISFEGFNSELQREHFNENYMESTKYPKIKFSGNILGSDDFKKPGIYKVVVKGTLSLHGQDQERQINALMTVSEGKIIIRSKFNVRLDDHNIKIPKIVDKKIAEIISCDVKATLAPK